MSPRTKAQQIEYNTKRRNLSAAKKAPLHGVKGQSVQVVKSAKLTPPKPSKQSKALFDKMNKVVDKALAPREAKPHNLTKYGTGTTRGVKPAQKVSIKAAEEASKVFRGAAKFKVDIVKDTMKLNSYGPVKGVDKAVEVGPNPPTMALSYVRNGAAGLGMKRGNNYQSTVTFTPAQFMELREKAEFNRRSLAEQIRWSVMQTLRGAR